MSPFARSARTTYPARGRDSRFAHEFFARLHARPVHSLCVISSLPKTFLSPEGTSRLSPEDTSPEVIWISGSGILKGGERTTACGQNETLQMQSRTRARAPTLHFPVNRDDRTMGTAIAVCCRRRTSHESRPALGVPHPRLWLCRRPVSRTRFEPRIGLRRGEESGLRCSRPSS